MNQPNATGRIEINASADDVYALVSDPAMLAELAEEYSTFRWLDGATHAQIGARFRGGNQRGLRRWSTLATITEAAAAERFAFEVTFARLPISRGQYDIEQNGDGCVVTESTWDNRPGWLKLPTSTATGVFDRDEHNQRNIATTLRRLKDKAETR